MFAGRAGTAVGLGGPGGKAGKFSVADLYGLNRKPKASGVADGLTRGPRGRDGQAQGQRSDEELAPQILRAAQNLMERRRLELYLREHELSITDSTAQCTHMTYRNVGKSGLRVSCLGLGTWLTFGSQISDEAAERLLIAAYDHGVNVFETAEVYASGRAEVTLGNILKKTGWRRSSFVITTKLYWGGEAETERGLSRKHILEGLHGSLSRLQMDYVDIVFAHRMDVNTPMEELVRAMTSVVEQGLALYWGTSRWSPMEIMEAYAVARQFNLLPPVCEQAEYHYFQREKVEVQLPELYHKIGVGMMTCSPLASGVISGKYCQQIPESCRANLPGCEWLKTRLDSDDARKQMQKIEQLHLLAGKMNCTAAQLAIAWCLRSESVCVVLLGVSSTDQLLENLDALKILSLMTPDLLMEIDSILRNKPRSRRENRILDQTCTDFNN